MISGMESIRRGVIKDEIENEAPYLLEKYTLMQLVLRVRTERRVSDKLKWEWKKSFTFFKDTWLYLGLYLTLYDTMVQLCSMYYATELFGTLNIIVPSGHKRLILWQLTIVCGHNI